MFLCNVSALFQKEIDINRTASDVYGLLPEGRQRILSQRMVLEPVSSSFIFSPFSPSNSFPFVYLIFTQDMYTPILDPSALTTVVARFFSPCFAGLPYFLSNNAATGALALVQSKVFLQLST